MFCCFHIFEIYALAVLWAFMAIAASQTGDADYSRTPLFLRFYESLTWYSVTAIEHQLFFFSYIFKVLTQVLLHVCLCPDSEWHRVLPRPLHYQGSNLFIWCIKDIRSGSYYVTGDTDSYRAPGLTSSFKRSMNIHRHFAVVTKGHKLEGWYPFNPVKSHLLDGCCYANWPS